MSQGKHMTDDEIIEANRRLLFAAARGARLRIFADKTRIHPDDAHLQYGPISTALRDCDGDFQWLYIDTEQMHYFAIQCAILADYANNMMQEWQQNKDRLTRSLFLLILAEALADEGM